MIFNTIKQTMVTVQNYANMSVRTKYLLSHQAKKLFPTLIVLTLHQRKCKRKQLTFRSYANSNHQRAFVLPRHESVVNTNYRSTVCEAGHTLWEAPEDALQYRIVSVEVVLRHFHRCRYRSSPLWFFCWRGLDRTRCWL
jgi:hypothetical protein